jgi:periplasmic protein TonB
MELRHILILLPNGAGSKYFSSFRNSGIKTTTMKTELILKSDVLDIIFEHRNKSYGAYNLRKFYDNRLMKSIAVTMGIVTLLSAFTFISPKKEEAEKIVFETTAGYIKPLEKKPEIKEKKVVPPATQKPVDSKRFISKMAIIKDSVPPIDAIKLNDVISNVTTKAPDGGGEVPVVGKTPGESGPGGGGGTGDKPAEPAIDINTPIFVAEIMPAFPGGMDGLRKFLERNLTNPRDLEEGEAISVKVRFVVGFDGKLKSFETVQDGGAEFNKEVIRVLKKMPDWIPGKSRGQNVSVYYTIPVKFVSVN